MTAESRRRRGVEFTFPVYATSYHVLSPQILNVGYILEDPRGYQPGDNTAPWHILEPITFDPTDPDWGKTVRWWLERSRLAIPNSAGAAVVLVERGAVAETLSLTIRATSTRVRIVRYTVNTVPTIPAPPWDELQKAAEAANECNFALTVLRP